MDREKARAWFNRFAPVTRGGPGSGNYGHKGVPGQHGGSAPHFQSFTFAGKELSKKEIEAIRSEISDTWEDLRRGYAIGAISSMYRKGGVALIGKSKGEIVSMAGLSEPVDSEIISRHLPKGMYRDLMSAATKRRGYGRSMMEDVKKLVKKEDGIGIVLVSDPHSVGFYKKLGMKEVGPGWNNAFYWTAEDLQNE